jgi:hypothetical protein
MKSLLKYSLILALVLGANMAAYADPPPWSNGHHHDPDPPKPYTAPEVDAALAFGGLALVGGTIAVLRSRRSSKS